MRILAAIFLVILMSFFYSCGPSANLGKPSSRPDMESPKTFFETLFKGDSILETAALNREAWNVQVIYTKIDRSASNKPKLTTYTYNNNPQYFYPASTVKLPIALLSLQRLNELEKRGIDKNSTMITEAAYAGQSPVYNDPNSPDGRPTISNYIRKIFLISDNDASNRLYEFLGQAYINKELNKKGYDEAQILHRLAISLKEDENRHTNPVKFYDIKGQLIYEEQLKRNEEEYAVRNDFSGRGYYASGKLINAPMDFSKKNRISLNSLHSILSGVVFPGRVSKQKRFQITESDRNFLLEQMSMYPAESVYPAYDSSTYYNAYTKFMFYGAQRVATPDHIRIFNKCGNAYGQLVDVAYFCDFENKVEFLVSAAITCNTDGILNDDKYDYETIGFPFMKSLGRALYSYELKRVKKHLPDLSSFVYRYNK